jgi:hypothetical protein
MSIRPVRPLLLALAFLVVAGPAAAQCPGSCSAEIVSVPKTIEKYVKARVKALTACGKKGTPVCPIACPVPDATDATYGLSQTCADLLDCNLDALAETFYDTTWDDLGVCALAPADACGNARAAQAGKLVSKKLIRRRTSKMDKFAKDRASCVTNIDKVGACGGAATCDAASDWIDGILPISIGKKGYQIVPVTVGAPGEGVATLTLAAATADWGTLGRESVVLSYDLDGTKIGTIVVHSSAPIAYRLLLGAVTAGDHTIGLRQEKKLSPADDSPVLIEASASIEAITSGDPRYDLTRFAPILLGLDADLNIVPIATGTHPGNAVSDMPVVLYARPIAHAGFTTYRYTMIWTNEDGGTGQFPDVLIARYGRTTDIETFFEVDVSDVGVLQAVRFRPDESGSLATFNGAFQGTHPIVRTSTGNGLIADDGESTLHFTLVPFLFDDNGLPRELGMDLDPISYVLMTKEMIREDKIEPLGNANTKKLSDDRNYLYVDYDIDLDVGGQVLRGIAVVNSVTYYSDHNQSFTVALNPRVSEGIGRLAIELPPGTAIGDIQSYGMQGVGVMSGTLFTLNAFLLEADALPGTPLTFSGSQVQSGTNPTWTVTP